MFDLGGTPMVNSRQMLRCHPLSTRAIPEMLYPVLGGARLSQAAEEIRNEDLPPAKAGSG